MFKDGLRTYTKNMSFPEYLYEQIENKDDLVKITDTIYGLASRIEEEKKDRQDKEMTLLVISGLSGAGKDSIANRLIERDKRFGWVKTCTTREQRPEEVENDPYIRLTEEEFQEAQKKGDVIESVAYADYHYCSLGSVIRKAFDDFETPILRIDPRGSATYTEKWRNEENIFDKVNLICVFVVPPTIAVLKERLMERSKSEAFMEKRMAQMALDLPFINQTEYIVINETGKLEMAVDDVASLVSSK